MNDNNLVDVARNSIKTHGPESKAFPSIGLFAKHHRDEIPSEYWTDHIGTGNPSLDEILSILVPVDSDDEENELEDDDVIDFTLPSEVTQYVLCVSLDESGEIVDISMES